MAASKMSDSKVETDNLIQLSIQNSPFTPLKI